MAENWGARRIRLFVAVALALVVVAPTITTAA
jgi:hypothetical protein